MVSEPADLVFRFFDLDLHLVCDSPPFSDLFLQMYRRVLASRFSAPTRLEVVVHAGWDNRWGRPTVVLDGAVHPILDRRLLEGFLYETILSAVVRGVRSHFLIHAGALVADDRAVILSGDAFHGKTTTVLALLRRGFRFLSDEMAAIGRMDGLVHPFPRSLRIRPDTLARTGWSETATASTWLDKYLLDPEELRAGCLGEPTPPGHVFILAAPDGERRKPGGVERLTLALDRADDELLEAVRRLPGVCDVRVSPWSGAVCLDIGVSTRRDTQAAVERLCREQGIWVLAGQAPVDPPVDFSRLATLEPIPASQAAAELLRRFEGGPRAALLQDVYGGRSTRMFADLVRLIGPARCWRLSVGHIDGMADLICRAVGLP